MTAKVIQHKYIPRPQMAAFHARHHRWALIVAHRRYGKTVAVVQDMVVRAMRTQKPNAFYAYCAPYYGQAKQTAWMYIKDAVRDIPGTKVSESETSVLLPNGSKIRVYGADNPDALRGIRLDGVVCDEFGDWQGRASSAKNWRHLLRAHRHRGHRYRPRVHWRNGPGRNDASVHAEGERGEVHRP